MSARDELRRTPGIHDLVHRCLDGTASEAEAALLDGLVATDPSAARALAAAARWESTMEIVARTTSDAAWEPAPIDLARPVARRRLVWAAGAVAAAAAAVVIAWSLSRARPSVNAVAQPAPAVAPPASAPAPQAPIPATIPAIPSPEHRPTELRLADGSTATLLGADARLETRRSTAAAIDLALVRGAAHFDVVHRPGRRFRIWVASAYIEVVGTAFTVDRLAEGVRVSVDRGVVKVVSAQGQMRLGAGSSDVFPIESGSDSDGAAAAAAKRPAAVSRPPARTDDQAGALLRASEHARKEGRPDEALVLLRRFLSQHGGDPRAPYAGFIIGRVLLEELDRPREAAAAFARVEVLNPRTPLIEDALAREVESWFRAGDLEKARQRARSFLERYPQGRRAGEVRRYGQME